MSRRHGFVFLALLLFGWISSACAPEPDGAVVFEQHCATCHREPLWPRAPNLEMMEGWTPQLIVTTLTTGAMQDQGSGLTMRERTAVAEYISRQGGGAGVGTP